MRKIAPRATTILVLTCAVGLLAAPAAIAGTTESGTRYCTINYNLAAKARGAGFVAAEVGHVIVGETRSSVFSIYNDLQLTAGGHWETYADTSYDSKFSGGYCSHV